MCKVFTVLLSLLTIQVAAQNYTEQLDSVVQKQGVSERDPALFIGVVKDGEIIYRSTNGLASLQHGVLATETTRCNIASTAKQFTALMILDLVQKSQISLEDDIRKFLPQLYPNIEDSIKVRHLINHTSGIRDYCDLMGLQQNPWWRREGLDNKDIVSFLAKQETLAFPPGSRYTYSNSGYNLLAQIIETVSGERFTTYSTNFFRQLGMTNTGFPKSYMQLIPNIALPYSDWGNGEWQQFPMLTSTYGEGFLFTTLDDQLHYEQLLQKAQETSNELLMQSQGPIPNSEDDSYGFGLRLSDRFNYPAVHHDGATGSYSSQVLRFPENRLSIFIMTSNSRVSTDALLDDIVQLILDEKAPIPNYNPLITSISKKPIPIQDIQAQYQSQYGRLVCIENEEEQLIWRTHTGAKIPLMRETENLYYPYYDKDLKIGFFESELVVFNISGDTTRYPKLNIKQPSYGDSLSYTGQYYSTELDLTFTILKNGDTLSLQFEKWKKPRALSILNRNELIVDNYMLSTIRDPFDRITGISLSLGRALNNTFQKTNNLQFQPSITTVGGTISVNTIPSVDGSASDILLTKNYLNGNEIWNRQFGGKSYDKANTIIATDDGFLIIGSTSSYGVGNYDIIAIKTDKNGRKKWQQTYGFEMNDYGYTAEPTTDGFLIKGSTQTCKDDLNDCKSYVWHIHIDTKGNTLSSTILNEL